MGDIAPAFFGFLVVAFVVLVVATHPNFVKTGVGAIAQGTGDILGAAATAGRGA